MTVTHKNQGLIALFSLLMLAAVLLGSATAQSQETPSKAGTRWATDPFLDRSTAVDAHSSLAGPNGLGGATVTQTFSEDFALSVGAGSGLTGAGVSVMPRLTFLGGLGGPYRNHALSVGLGASVFTLDTDAQFICILDCYNPRVRADAALWLNGELAYTYQHHEGFRLGGYLGVTSLMAGHNVRYGEPDVGGLEPGKLEDSGIYLGLVPYAGVFVGFAF